MIITGKWARTKRSESGHASHLTKPNTGMKVLTFHMYQFRRVEPGVEFSCSVDYDPFALMQEKDMKYGEE
jgi:Glycolipid 2-alpha-mannosyltransferase